MMSETSLRADDIPSATSTKTERRRRDTRTFWRLLLAVVAPLPMLCMGAVYVIKPVEGDAPFPDTVAAIAAQRQLYEVLLWLGLPFLVGLIPAVIAVAWVTRRQTPVLTTVGAAWTLLGCLSAFPLLAPDDLLAYLAVTERLDLATVAALDEAWWALPVTEAAALLFISGIVVGLPLLGIALWRSRVAPRWMATALIIGGATHPFLPNHVVAGMGLLVAGLGFAGATRALLRMPNDEFDLPPVTNRSLVSPDPLTAERKS
jgi:hypothetical protein